VPGADWPNRESKRQERDAQAGHIGDQMGGVGEQRQRVKDQPAKCLHDEQSNVDAQRPLQRAELGGSWLAGFVAERVAGSWLGHAVSVSNGGCCGRCTG